MADWKTEIRKKFFLAELIITIIILAITLSSLAGFLKFIEQRSGAVLNDPLLNIFKPVDLTYPIFIILYAGLLFAVYVLAANPRRLMIALQTYIILVIIRMLAMYLLALDPPQTMIPLSDPFVEFFGTGRLLTKDLFFSGHTAILFLVFLVVTGKWKKAVFLILTILIASGVILQHVHYSIDVIAAPFFSYSAYRIALLLHKENK